MAFNELPLGNVLDFYNGKSIKPGGEGVYPVYGSNGIIGGSDEAIYSDALIIGRVGAYCGAVNYCKTQFWASDNTIVAKTKEGYDTQFSYYLLSNIDLHSYAGGAAQPLLTQTTIKQVKVRVPQFPVQRRIADILSAYDDLIENNTRRIRILEGMAQAFYQEWFGKVNKESLPEGWSLRPFGEVSENFDFKRIPVSGIEREKMQGEYPYYGASGIIDYINDYIFAGRYLLIAEDGENLNSRKTPIAFFANGKFWVNNHAHIIQAKPPLTLEFLYLFFANQEMSGFITGAAQPKLSQQNLNGIPMMIPPQELMDKFNNFAQPAMQEVELLRLKNANLRQTRDLLLPRLVSGEIEVSGLNDN